MPRKRSQLLTAALAGTMVDLHVLLGPESRIPPTEFRIFRKGINKSDKGEFLFDEQAAGSVMAAYARKGVDVMIDYDHAVLHAPEVKAIAAGWCSFEVREGELWATKVTWTPTALDHFAKAEYRYFSPLFDYEPRTGRIQHVINSALTNTPALHGLDALVAASAHTQQEEEMDPKLEEALNQIAELKRQAAARDKELETLRGQTAIAALSSTLGLPSTTGQDEVRSRIVSLTGFHKSIMALSGKDSEAAAIGALTAAVEQAKEVGQLREKAEVAEAAALAADFGAYLDGLSKAGADGRFLPPAKRKKAESLALSLGDGKLTKKGVEAAKEYVVDMLESGEAAGGTRQPASQMALSSIEEEILRTTNSSREQLLKLKSQKLAGGNAG
jgi:phage I-like protein